MPIDITAYQRIRAEIPPHVTLVAVSKTKPIEDIQALYDLGQRDFGENYVQELVEKQAALPTDIRWHFIGHLQSNKVKYIAPFVHLIHGVDRASLLPEINKQAGKHGRTIDVLWQMHIAQEETKFGFDADELQAMIKTEAQTTYPQIHVRGMMGMASFTDNQTQVKQEFEYLKKQFDQLALQMPSNTNFDTLSMGMSGDYRLAIACGSTIIRVGSLLFGARQYSNPV